MFTSEKNEQVTILIGSLQDQAELSGVLNTLYEMHVALISVERLNSEPFAENG